MYYDDEFYNEPSEFDIQINEFKQSLLKSVKSEFIDEMNRLRAENEELQEVKKNFEQIKNEYRAKERQLEYDRQDLQRKVRRERLTELMKDIHIVTYRARTKKVKLPKCDKCDSQRRIVFRSPSGKEMHEYCECNEGKNIYVPEECEAAEFTINHDGKTMSVWYCRKYEDSDHYHSTDRAEHVYKSGTPFEEIKNYYHTYFRAKEECQAYCDWLNADESTKG